MSTTFFTTGNLCLRSTRSENAHDLDVSLSGSIHTIYVRMYVRFSLPVVRLTVTNATDTSANAAVSESDVGSNQATCLR